MIGIILLSGISLPDVSIFAKILTLLLGAKPEPLTVNISPGAIRCLVRVKFDPKRRNLAVSLLPSFPVVPKRLKNELL